MGDPDDEMGFGELVSKLFEVNHNMWINQEHVYNFAAVPENSRVDVINKCATLNIERNKYMNALEDWLARKLAEANSS
jgi:hypothetical protein